MRRAVLITGTAAVVPGPEALADPDWFDAKAHFGPRGWKYLSRASRYLLAAARRLDAPARGPADDPADDGASGVYVGTHDSITALHAHFDEVVRTEGARWLSPAELSGFAVNEPANQVAIAQGRRGAAVTLTNPLTAGLEAVAWAAGALRAGRLDTALAAAVEDPAPAATRVPGSAVAGGACAISLAAGDGAAGAETTGHGIAAGPVIAEIGGFLSGFVPDGNPGAARAVAARVAALVPGYEVRLACCTTGTGDAVAEEVRAALAARDVKVLDAAHLGAGGELGTVSPLLQLAGLARGSGPGLVLAASGSGPVTAVMLLEPDSDRPRRIP